MYGHICTIPSFQQYIDIDTIGTLTWPDEKSKSLKSDSITSTPRCDALVLTTAMDCGWQRLSTRNTGASVHLHCLQGQQKVNIWLFSIYTTHICTYRQTMHVSRGEGDKEEGEGEQNDHTCHSIYIGHGERERGQQTWSVHSILASYVMHVWRGKRELGNRGFYKNYQ